ncbi:MAG: leucine-rich repeat protein, partial [Burkholderiaceae bacterium]|nr:leucine-rich repeat protein [Burkholderiaceae bacterium]
AKAYIKYGDSSFGVAGADWNGLEVEILAQDGTYVCSTGLIKTTETTNLYTITTGVVDAHSSGKCAGAAVIRSGVTTIGDYAFSDATALSSITIPEGVTHIGKVAFSGATLLSS